MLKLWRIPAGSSHRDVFVIAHAKADPETDGKGALELQFLKQMVLMLRWKTGRDRLSHASGLEAPNW